MAFDPAKTLDVSRETLDRLEAFHGLVRKWSPRINLVGRRELNQLWERHTADSLGLLDIVRMQSPVGGRVMDIGSGAGFPIIPLAVAAQDENLTLKFTAVESDHRKAAFLRAVSSELGLSVDVQAKRLEHVSALDVALITARAVAETSRLLHMISGSKIRAEKVALLKGVRIDQELTSAASCWHMRYQRTVHPYGADGYILLLEGRSCDDKRSRDSR